MRFIIFWLDGKSQVVTGPDIAKACNNAGIGGVAVSAIDFYAKESDIAGHANCQCVRPVKDRPACEHDIALAKQPRKFV